MEYNSTVMICRSPRIETNSNSLQTLNESSVSARERRNVENWDIVNYYYVGEFIYHTVVSCGQINIVQVLFMALCDSQKTNRIGWKCEHTKSLLLGEFILFLQLFPVYAQNIELYLMIIVWSDYLGLESIWRSHSYPYIYVIHILQVWVLMDIDSTKTTAKQIPGELRLWYRLIQRLTLSGRMILSCSIHAKTLTWLLRFIYFANFIRFD